MTIEEFCKRIAEIENLTNAQKAITILWFYDQLNCGISMSAYELAKIIREHHIGNPNRSSLSDQIKKTGCIYSTKNSFRLRQEKKAEVRSWIEHILTGVVSEVPISSQYLDEQIWKHTRTYIEKVCIQLNGAYHQSYYDCAAVMVRRIVETLIIEAYESQKREEDIRNVDGNYYMLNELVSRASQGLPLGRETKKDLILVKQLGDRSAHNRRYNAKKSDLDKLQMSLRVIFEELANIAGFYDKK